MLSADVQQRVANEFDSIKDVVFLSSSFTTMPPKCVQKAYHEHIEKWLTTLPNSEWWEWGWQKLPKMDGKS